MVRSGELKTSGKMRVAIIAVAVLMLGSTVALYMGIVLGYNNSGQASEVDPAKKEEFDAAYAEYTAKVEAQAAELSGRYFDTFVQYKSEVRSFNAADVTGVVTRDLVVGTGAEVTEGSSGWSAYYIGWLADETIFDSSLNSTDGPTALKTPLAGGTMIEGWNQGIIGMRLGGVREIAMPAELGYGSDERGTIPPNSALKFVVMLIDPVERIDWTERMYELYDEVYGETQ